MPHIVKATELKLLAKFHDDWSKQSVSNATAPNYAKYEVPHALTCLRGSLFVLYFWLAQEFFNVTDDDWLWNSCKIIRFSR